MRAARRAVRAARLLQGSVQLAHRGLDHSVRGRRISRDQWDADTEYVRQCWDAYRRDMERSWSELEQARPHLAERIDTAVSLSQGRVLELGSGIGTMTRWLAERDEVSEIVAVDGFRGAIDALESYAIPKVTPHLADLTALGLDGERFDTVLACEVVEHLYADEEDLLVERLRGLDLHGARYVLSVPLGPQPSVFHVRGFTARSFRRHAERVWGTVEGWRAHGLQTQSVWGRFRT